MQTAQIYKAIWDYPLYNIPLVKKPQILYKRKKKDMEFYSYDTETQSYGDLICQAHTNLSKLYIDGNDTFYLNENEYTQGNPFTGRVYSIGTPKPSYLDIPTWYHTVFLKEGRVSEEDPRLSAMSLKDYKQELGLIPEPKKRTITRKKKTQDTKPETVMLIPVKRLTKLCTEASNATSAVSSNYETVGFGSSTVYAKETERITNALENMYGAISDIEKCLFLFSTDTGINYSLWGKPANKYMTLDIPMYRAYTDILFHVKVLKSVLPEIQAEEEKQVEEWEKAMEEDYEYLPDLPEYLSCYVPASVRKLIRSIEANFSTNRPLSECIFLLNR